MGKSHEEKIEVIRKYLGKMTTGFSYHIKGDIPSKKIDNEKEYLIHQSILFLTQKWIYFQKFLTLVF